MSVGSTVRRVMGPAFPLAGRAYRRAFLNVREVARTFPVLPPGSTLLDVGGGDGEVLNHLLDRQPDLRVVSVDIAPNIGGSLRPDILPRVQLLPGVSVRGFIEQGGEPAKAAFLCDVLHHVPAAERVGLLRDVLAAVVDDAPVLVVKEIVPAGVRSRAAFWADRNISGDRGVQAISPVELVDLIRTIDPTLVPTSSGLLDLDHPNYMLVFTRSAS